MKMFALAAMAVLAVSVFAQGPGGQGGPGGGQGRGQGRGQGGMMGGGMRQQMGPAALLRRADVQADLKLTDEQKGQLQALNQKMMESMRGSMGQPGQGGQDPEAMRTAMQKMQEENDAAIAKILTPEQNKRLKEIRIQLEGNRILMDKAFQKELGLSEAQIKKITDLDAAQRQQNQALMQQVMDQQMTQEQAAAARQDMQKKFDADLANVLTADQKTKMNSMKGEPFKADPNIRGGGGGFGGGGRGPGGGGGRGPGGPGGPGNGPGI